MTKTKPKRKPNNRSKYSTKIHNSRRRTLSTISATTAKKTILSVILLVSLVVVVALLSMFMLNRENQIKSRIHSIATDYYENYFYDKLAQSPAFQDKTNLDASMEKYREQGFSPMTLRDLLLYDNKKNYEYHDSLVKYCDENSTIVKFYIDPPYEKNSYHMDIVYSCNF